MNEMQTGFSSTATTADRPAPVFAGTKCRRELSSSFHVTFHLEDIYNVSPTHCELWEPGLDRVFAAFLGRALGLLDL